MKTERIRGWGAVAVLMGLWLALTPAAFAQETIIRGTAGYRLGYGYTQEQLVENALTLEVTVDHRLGFDGKVHLGLDGRLPFSGETAKAELGEAYLDWYTDTTDWRVGRQVVNWGTADGFNPTNVVNPQGPLSPADLLMSGAAPEGEPVHAVQGSYYLASGGSLTGVGILEFVPAAGGQEMLRAIAARIGAKTGGGPLPVEGPAPVPSDGSQIEWAVRGDTMLGGHNVYLSYFRGWDDFPAAWVQFAPSPVGPLPERVVAAYRRVQKIGLATAGTLGGAGIWTELAYTTFDHRPELDGPGALSSNAGYFEVVVGGDYTFAGGLMLSGQVIYNGGGSLLSPYKEPGAPVTPQTYLAVVARYSPRVEHNLEGIVLANAGDGGLIVMGRYAYGITQSVTLTVGASHVIASETAEFYEARDAANMVSAGIEFRF